MGQILDDIVVDMVENRDLKPEKSKLIIKWLVRFSVLAITFAFIIGQFRVKYLTKFETIDTEISSIKETNKKQDVLIKEYHDEFGKKTDILENEIKTNRELIFNLHSK